MIDLMWVVKKRERSRMASGFGACTTGGVELFFMEQERNTGDQVKVGISGDLFWICYV